jgi:predicted nucleotidyltransferase
MKHGGHDNGWGALPDSLTRADCPPRVRELLRELLGELSAALGDAIEGVYLFGSLTSGDFDEALSDVDLLVAVTSDLDDLQFRRLGEMHDSFARRHPDWADRLDLSYLSREALGSCKLRESPIVVISPGEPLNRKQTSPGWVMNWHGVRKQGVTLLGPPPQRLIARTSESDFVAAVRTHLREMPFRTRQSRSPKFHAYAVLTVCRGLFTCRNGGQASKTQAALWAMQQYPSWEDVIREALDQRTGRAGGRPDGDGDAERAERAAAFVEFAVQESGAMNGAAARRHGWPA